MIAYELFEKFVRMNRKQLLKQLRPYVRDIEDVQDIVQDVREILLTKGCKGLSTDSPDNYFWVMMKNTANDHRRKFGCLVHIPEEDEEDGSEAGQYVGVFRRDLADESLDPVEQLIDIERENVLTISLDRLRCSKPHREAFMRVTVYGEPADTVAEDMGISQNNLYVIIHRLKKKLEENRENMCRRLGD